ncbi:bifunctional aspartate kinase/homoserine dehydrogenase I [Myroides marinus]|uniref:bifunctional aspartate kinase/homoserine dehydrogenase I n=1 Tax=Myroides marinus TaxID=703342 RepID=UPI0025768B8E|nr:bifunctional aspartate kinase/homoserine dehydrogenase I [Myroides marinus]MDM1380976.1 bifunctional aspartate kinase/homoserine dehydrogenase I [Myroides marinus]MDM1388248.1 bifunctional aspartate kinase/homoserine dehydrogenase I [Myroides marinus]MDM1395459.1 bifunctional aspartate kinase/homoserine dehydrogenase I [Myroides marinus]MDM1501032.1 bifunctional aspartate kinase/homoserine dehydrogenase I [Myroides marinus]
MKVIKFGGSSVANAVNIKRCVDIIKNINEPVIVVVSALSGVTDLLQLAAVQAAAHNEEYINQFKEISHRHLEVVRALIPVNQQAGILSSVIRDLNELEVLLQGCYLLRELSPRIKDLIMSFGERLSSYVIAEVMKAQGEDCRQGYSGAFIKTNDKFGKASVNFEVTDALIVEYFKQNPAAITIVPGFIAESAANEVTTLGRGGSDYTAAIIAASLDLKELEIWTDVSGIYTANPRVVKQAKIIKHINFQEAMELSHFGAKVLYPSALAPILPKGISLIVKNTFEPDAEGSLVSTIGSTDPNPVRGITNIDNLALLTLEGPGMVGVAGISKRLFEVLSLEDINVIFITQASSEHSICFAIIAPDADKAERVINAAFEFEIQNRKVKPVRVELGMSIIAVVGDYIKGHQGVSGRMFSALGRNNINICAIAQGASERNISAVILEKDVKKALNVLHEAFFEEVVVQLNLFVMGIGNVGGKFLEQIVKQHYYLKEHLKVNIRVVGIANSKLMCFNVDGFNLSEVKDLSNCGVPMTQGGFLDKIKELNLRNSVFVDNTATAEVAMTYGEYLKKSIAVVTCNKIACSSTMDYYKELKGLSKKYNAPFLYETNVGAGLPIIDTIKNLVASGDQVKEIQAVLSGSLNFIFNQYNGSKLFADVVALAKQEGYTEPHPLIDLSGVDVKRKLMILMRESNYWVEEEDIEVANFLPESCMGAKDADTFIAALAKEESHFKGLYNAAKAKGACLKVVATLKDGKACVGLQEIKSDHPFYHLEGKDNIVLFFTDRYKEQPLLIKGAGAGAEVTASGIFADVIRIGSKLV